MVVQQKLVSFQSCQLANDELTFQESALRVSLRMPLVFQLLARDELSDLLFSNLKRAWD